ncbi:MAG: MarC family protein [Bacteroidales bacterium]|nr:MarC family protein [Bacteroidales bacterium]
MNINFMQIVSASVVLFAVLDIIGSMPIVIAMRDRGEHIDAWKSTLVAFVLLFGFMYLGEALLKLFSIDIHSFAVAGAIVLLILGMEMVFGLQIFKQDAPPNSASIVPLAFPLLAGPGSFTTIISLRAEYADINIIIALILNMLFVYVALHSTEKFSKILGVAGVYVTKKFAGIILLAISVRLFMTNLSPLLSSISQ